MYMSGAPVFMYGDLVLMDATQKVLLYSLALGAKGNCTPGSSGTVPIGERVLGRLPHPGYFMDSGHTLAFW